MLKVGNLAYEQFLSQVGNLAYEQLLSEVGNLAYEQLLSQVGNLAHEQCCHTRGKRQLLLSVQFPLTRNQTTKILKYGLKQ